MISKNIKNYTTSISASKSISEIIDFVIEINASGISQVIEDKKCIAINFAITEERLGNTITYRLKANPEAAYQILISKRKRITPEIKENISIQANKVAWRILRDWVHAQCALIQLGQATPIQLFLSYALDEKTNTTIFERIQNGEGLRLLN